MTLNGQNALWCRKDTSFGAYCINFNEDRPILSANIRCMRIFAGVPLGGGIKWECQWGCRRLQFWRFEWLLPYFDLECPWTGADVQTSDSSSGIVADEQCVFSCSHRTSRSPEYVHAIPTTFLQTRQNNAVCSPFSLSCLVILPASGREAVTWAR